MKRFFSCLNNNNNKNQSRNEMEGDADDRHVKAQTSLFLRKVNLKSLLVIGFSLCFTDWRCCCERCNAERNALLFSILRITVALILLPDVVVSPPSLEASSAQRNDGIWRQDLRKCSIGSSSKRMCMNLSVKMNSLMRWHL